MQTVRKFVAQSYLGRLPLSHLAVYSFYLIIAIAITWPLMKVFSTYLAGGFLTDAYQISRHSWWIKHALQTGQPIFDQPAMGYPDGLSGALIWGNPLQFFPAWLFAFFMPLPAAYNLTLLLRLALDGWAAYWLVYYLTGKQRGPALVAGFIFMTYPALQGRIYGGHSDVLTLWPGPLYVYALWQLRESNEKKWIAMAAGFFVLGLAGNTSLLVYNLMPLAGVFLLLGVLSREWVWLKRSVIATGLGMLLSMIFLVPVALETWSNPQYDTEIGGSIRYSADLLGIVSPSFFHPAFDEFTYNRHVLGINLVEGLAYMGIIPTLLAIIGFWKQPAARRWLVLAAIVWIFSLGPVLKIEDKPVMIQLDQFEGSVYESYLTLPWAVLQKLPILNITRTPGRFNLPLGLAVAVMAGYGVATVWRYIAHLNGRWRYGVLIPLLGVIFWEYRSFWPMPNVPATVPQAVYDLAKRDDICAVFDIPWDDRILAKHGLYFQTAHEKPMIAGQFIRDTPVSRAKLSILQQTLNPALLDWAGVDIVIWHKTGGPQADMLNTLSHEKLGAPFYEDANVALFEVPEAETPPEFTALLTPQTAIQNIADSYFFVPAAGWVDFAGMVDADGREVAILLEGEQVYALEVEGETSFRIPLPVPAAGFYTVRLEMHPACPLYDNVAVACRELEITQLALENFIPAPLDNRQRLNIAFERGLHLEHASLGETIVPGAPLPLRLWWRFDEPLTEFDVRFVHVLDENNTPITQSDQPLPVDYAHQSQWVEIPAITLPATLAPGRYRVVVGWYTYPAIKPFTIQSSHPQVMGNTVLIGTFEIKEKIIG